MGSLLAFRAIFLANWKGWKENIQPCFKQKVHKNSVLSNGALQLSIFQARRLSRWVRLPKTIPLKPPTECRLRGFKVWGHGTPRLLNQQRPSMLMPPAESHFDRWKLNSITRPRNVCQRLDDPYTMPNTSPEAAANVGDSASSSFASDTFHGSEVLSDESWAVEEPVIGEPINYITRPTRALQISALAIYGGRYRAII